MIASARAHPNIGLVKYWGKRDATLNLPLTGSLGVTIDRFSADTTVAFDSRLTVDELTLNGRQTEPGASGHRRVERVLDELRRLSGSGCRATVSATTDFPEAAGFASSAAGFAALAAAGAAALELSLDRQTLSRVARLGSGSAARSVCGGFVEWSAGVLADGSDCEAKTVASLAHWPGFTVICCTVERSPKKIPSREAMERAQRTSPLFPEWVSLADAHLPLMRRAIAERDLAALGCLVEASCLAMHATIHTAEPPHCYWNEATVELMNRIVEAREHGRHCYFTIDAGPQVKVICEAVDVHVLSALLNETPGVLELAVCSAGPGVEVFK